MTTNVFDCQACAIIYINEFVRHETNNNPTPASKPFINSLKTIKATKSILKAVGDAMTTCPICMDDFELDHKLVRLPCRHWFHCDCILPWLKGKSTCPMCRYQLPTPPPFQMETLQNGFKLFIQRSTGEIITLEVRQEATEIWVYLKDAVIGSRSRPYARLINT